MEGGYSGRRVEEKPLWRMRQQQNISGKSSSKDVDDISYPGHHDDLMTVKLYLAVNKKFSRISVNSVVRTRCFNFFQYIFEISGFEEEILVSLEQFDRRTEKDKGKSNYTIGTTIVKVRFLLCTC